MVDTTYIYQSSTAGLSSFIMPSGFKSNVEVHMWGAGGASGQGSSGGGASYTTSIITINLGDQVSIGIGTSGKARSAGVNGFPYQYAGGAGGGNIPFDNDSTPGDGGGGGAATAITINNVMKLVAAGGGGGAGQGSVSAAAANGIPGDGGSYTTNTNGTDGLTGFDSGGSGGGGGGFVGGLGGGVVIGGDDISGIAGCGGRSLGSTIVGGNGIIPGGRGTEYCPTAVYGGSDMGGYVVLVFTRTFGLFNKINGAWSAVQNSWVKVNNNWQPIKNIYVKSNGGWSPILSTTIPGITTGQVVALPPPPPVSVPGYAIAASSSAVGEGSSVSFTITTTNIPDGTTLYWTTSGTCVSAARFSDSVNSGSVTTSNGIATITRPVFADHVTEGQTSFSINILAGSTSGTLLITSPVITVYDTSLTPTYSVSATSGSVNEGSSAIFVVTTTSLDNNTTLYWSTSGVGANRFSDGVTSGAVIINNNTATIVRPILADNRTEGSASFTLSVNGAYAGSVTINDTSTTPIPTYSISPNHTNINETTNPTVYFSVNTTNVPDGTIMNWNTTGSVDGGRFTDGASSGTVVVSGQSASFSRSMVADNYSEGTTSFAIALNYNGSVVATSASVSVADTSPSPAIPVYSVSASPTTVNEGDTISFSFNATNTPNGTGFSWNLVGSAASASRFTAGITGGPFTVTSGNWPGALTVVNDYITEGTTSFAAQMIYNGTVVATSPYITITDTSITPHGSWAATSGGGAVTVPDHVYSINVTLYGGGGGSGGPRWSNGRNGYYGDFNGTGSGGHDGQVVSTTMAVSPGQTINYSVGGGGGPGDGYNSHDGAAGGATIFNGTVAGGGAGGGWGAGGWSDSAQTYGQGGSSSGSSYSTGHAGSSGAIVVTW